MYRCLSNVFAAIADYSSFFSTRDGGDVADGLFSLGQQSLFYSVNGFHAPAFGFMFGSGSLLSVLLLVLMGCIIIGLAVWVVRLKVKLRSRIDPVEDWSQQQNLLRSWLLRAPIAISVFKKTSDIVLVNERFTQLLGYETSDFRNAGEMWSILIQDENKRKNYVAQWLQQLEKPWNPEWQVEEVVVTGKSGRVTAIETHVSQIGEYWICLHNDVTWRSKIQRKLENALNQTFKANKAKTQFLTNMSHEIRTPLNGVLGMAQLLSETTMTADQRQFLETIQTSGEMLLMTINDILDLSKIEAGTIILESNPFNIRQCIEDSITVCMPKLDKENVTFSSHIASDVPVMVRGDVYRVSQIVVNLLSNAFKYTHAGSVVMEVKSVVEHQQSPKLSISFKDTGIGIPLEKQSKIFDAFEQADASITREYGGTGLGLTICKRIADRMGGEIELLSQPGHGTEFIFSWTPLPSDDERRPDEAQPGASDWDDQSLAGLKTLVVEDNKVNSKVIMLSLKKFGVTCETALNGKEALGKLREGLFDLIFMDIQMPEMDGLQCTEAIRETFPDSQQPFIIALTAHALADHMEQCRKVGMNGFVAKPFSAAELKKALRLYWTEKDNSRKNVYF